MRISIVINSKLPVRGYGGTERIAYWLGRELAILGHKVTFVCQATGPIHFAKTKAWNTDPKATFDQQLERSIDPESDIVHFFSKPIAEPKRPYLVTIEGNGKPGESFHPNTVFVSKNHAERHGWSEYVYNGVALEEYPLFTGAKKDQLVFLAKASWKVKNLKGAIQIAQESGLHLRICGGNKPWHKWPHSKIHYLGTVDGKEKLREISDARALIFPVLWDEPFGIAVIESLAVGTPVLASPFGSLPEIITPDCGRICHSHQDFVEAVRDLEQISPVECRKRVETHFSAKIMAQRYMKVYERVLQEKYIRAGYPQVPENSDPGKMRFYTEAPGAP